MLEWYTVPIKRKYTQPIKTLDKERKHTMRTTKKDIYASYGIQYRTRDNKIFSPLLGQWIPRLLVNGNKKIGKGVWQWSVTAGNKAIAENVVERVIEKSADLQNMDANALRVTCGGTCSINCPGCYAQTGCYMFFSTKLSLARKTLLSRLALDWVEKAINAQIDADHIEYCRIHVAGDFFSNAYVEMWTRIAAAHPGTCFWTYTKQRFEALEKFDSLKNANIVKSTIGGDKIRFNFGKAGYIIALYEELKKAGKSVYICRCGIDANQHCSGCHHCFESEYVLFLEHSTGYQPEKDPDFEKFVALVNSQEKAAA